MDNKITKRLTRDTSYKTPDKTYQSTLSDTDIAKKLTDYIKVKPIDVIKIPLNTHLRYFSINPKTGEKQFRLGGVLTKIGDNNQYVVLSNGTLSWSVQINNTIFYKKLNINEIKEQVSNEATTVVQSQMEQIIEENKQLKKMLKQIKDTTISSKKNKK
jgi:hypothetical protein